MEEASAEEASANALAQTAAIEAPWRDPLDCLEPLADRPGAALLLSDPSSGRPSLLLADPSARLAIAPDDDRDAAGALRALRGAPAAGPGFAGGVLALFAYEFGARMEPLGLARAAGWPDLEAFRYESALLFAPDRGRVTAFGRGGDRAAAARAARTALAWLDAPRPSARPLEAPAGSFRAEASPQAYRDAVLTVTAKIAAGEIFQANPARAWTGDIRAGCTPFEAFARLVRASPAPYSAYVRTRDGALVSHSPELFLEVEPGEGRVRTRPIKGTRPRGADPAADAALGQELRDSAKDRAENLMIVDLMRNDLSRSCLPGTVTTPQLFELERFGGVQHLTSTVTGLLRPGIDAVDVLVNAFPAGSITGAPKVQAMRVISGLEPPRGPWCGSLAFFGFDGGLVANVLIRTVAFRRDDGVWRFRTLAGAGVVADSDPEAELQETEVKIAAVRRALVGP